MSYSLTYKSISTTNPLPVPHVSKNALAPPNISSLCFFPRISAISITCSGYRTKGIPIPRRLRAPRCTLSVTEVENGPDDSMQLQTGPSAAETSRTLMELCSEGTLCTLTEDGWPFGTAVRFAVDVQGMPVFCLDPSAVHARHVLLDKRCSLHVQLEQLGCRKAQCTLRGTLSKPEDKIFKQRLQSIWTRRFGEKANEDHLYVIAVEQVLQSQDLGDEGFWVDALEYSRACADPLRDCAAKIVTDMNNKHWEDIHRLSNVYADLDVEVEDARMIWMDRLGFDLRLMLPQRETMDVRIPFPREVTDEKDARSSLTYMAQIAWEVEKNYAPPEFERVKVIQKLRK